MPSARLPTSIPHGRTARRLEWQHLPPHVRRVVEEHCGSAVVEAVSQTAGFTPGLASVLTCEDGSRHFVKVASHRAQRAVAGSYRDEARKLGALTGTSLAPRLLWLHDAEDWVAFGVEHVEGRHPRRPWRAEDLASCVALTEELAATLTPPPRGLDADTVQEELAGWPACWARLRSLPPVLPGLDEHLDAAATLASAFAEVTGGETVVHTDVRDDNLLLADDGRVRLCDWSGAVVGAPWLDTVLLLIGPRGDGLDVEAVLAGSPLTRDVPAESVDILLALVTGYFLVSAAQPVPSTSPYLREVQRWQGEVCWRWLAERQRWDLGG